MLAFLLLPLRQLEIRTEWSSYSGKENYECAISVSYIAIHWYKEQDQQVYISISVPHQSGEKECITINSYLVLSLNLHITLLCTCLASANACFCGLDVTSIEYFWGFTVSLLDQRNGYCSYRCSIATQVSTEPTCGRKW